MSRVEYLQRQYENVKDWLKYVEAKNGILLSICAISIVGIFRAILAMDNTFHQSLIGFSTLPPLIIGLFISLLSFFPKTSMTNLLGIISQRRGASKSNYDFENSLIFFQKIRDLKPDEYLKKLIEIGGWNDQINQEILEKDYSTQIVLISQIIDTKLFLFRLALRLLFTSMALLIIFFYLDHYLL